MKLNKIWICTDIYTTNIEAFATKKEALHYRKMEILASLQSEDSYEDCDDDSIIQGPFCFVRRDKLKGHNND
jgi:hypothetical protein